MDTYSPEASAFEAMTSQLTRAVGELFATYGTAVEQCSTVQTVADDEQEYMAVIGYAGKGLRGALILLASEAAVSAWMNAAGIPDGDVADTIGEFSNMLLGRLKAHLLREGISIIATTPTTAAGTGLRFADPPGQCAWSAFEGSGWHLNVRLDAEFEPDFGTHLCQRVSKPAQPGDFIDFDLMPTESRL